MNPRQLAEAADRLDIQPFLDPMNHHLVGRYSSRIVSKALSSSPPRNDIIQALFSAGLIDGSLVTDTLIGLGFLEDARNYIQVGFPPTQEAEILAVLNGNISALNFLVQHGIQPSQAGANKALETLYNETRPAQIEMLEWYKQHGILPFQNRSIDAMFLNPQSAEWAVQNGISISIDRDSLMNSEQRVIDIVLPVARINKNDVYGLISDKSYGTLGVLVNAGYQFEPNMVDAMRTKANQGDVGMANLMRNAGLF